jgi:hypothetical protein
MYLCMYVCTLSDGDAVLQCVHAHSRVCVPT